MHYLEQELTDLIQREPKIWDFMQQGSLDGVWYWDLENPENEWLSPEFWRLFGYDPAQKQHDPAEWQSLIHPEDLQVALKNFDAHCSDSSHPYDQVVRYSHADGSTVWVRCRGLAIRDQNGRAIRMLGAHNDITAVKRAEEAARTEKTFAERANRHLRAFAYALSHDLQAPASTLAMLLDELTVHFGEAIDPEAQFLLDLGKETVQRMNEQIKAQLQFVAVAGGEEDFSPVDLAALTGSILEDLRADIHAAHAEVVVSKLPEVYGNAAQLRMLLQNLIENALKFRHADGKPLVRITANRVENTGATVICVADNGIGIAPKYRSKVFRLSEMLNAPKTYPGSGMGLALCQRVAERHGGRIWVEDSAEGGCAFFVELKGKEGKESAW